GVVGGEDRYLLMRGIKRVGLRMEEIKGKVEGIVEMLEKEGKVEEVLHGSIKEDMKYSMDENEGSGDRGVVCFEVKDREGGKEVIEGRK
uniref:PLP-dependent transferase n=1 Tax=Staphylococcus epidermidis TaxID=1282 RepID=UPI001642381E